MKIKSFIIAAVFLAFLQGCTSIEEAERELNLRSGFEDCALTKLWVNAERLYIARCENSTTSSATFKQRTITYD
jgi:hypothetical protein